MFNAILVNKLHAFGLKRQQDEYGILDAWFIIVSKVARLENPDKTVELNFKSIDCLV